MTFDFIFYENAQVINELRPKLIDNFPRAEGDRHHAVLYAVLRLDYSFEYIVLRYCLLFEGLHNQNSLFLL